MAKTPYEQVMEQYKCAHEINEIRYKIYSNGTRHYFKQCSECGQALSSAIPHKDVENLEDCKEWDNVTEDAYNSAVGRMLSNLRDEVEQKWIDKDTEWHKKYNKYIHSDKWKDKRARVLARDGYKCQACLRRKATQVHHTTYKRDLGDEPLFELISVCLLCHGALHHDRQEKDNE